MSIRQRKKEHVDLSVSGAVDYRKASGFHDFEFRHNALPEVNADEVDSSASLLGRTFRFPLFISSMTGGYTEAGAVNAVIARFCEHYDLPFGVGSQRILLDDPSVRDTFSVVREEAPHAFIASNIGGAQLVGGLPTEKLNLLIDSIRADAVIVHLNPLQELMQPEGDRKFKGIEAGIASLIQDSPVPVIVKETGAGISGAVAERLIDLGVDVIDLSGAGGTSWARVENSRSVNTMPQRDFDDWGLPTVDCLMEVNRLQDRDGVEIIASGGVRNSFDIAKSLCLGADFAAAAQPVIKAVVNGGYETLERLFQQWERQLKTILCLLGCTTIGELSEKHLVRVR